jgi:hypothetical protein
MAGQRFCFALHFAVLSDLSLRLSFSLDSLKHCEV